MVSDSSVQAPNGSFVCIIYRTNSKTHWSSHNTIAKGHPDLSSICTEVCDYLGVFYALCDSGKAFLLLGHSPPMYTNIYKDTLGVVHRSSDIPISIQQCLLPDWYIFNETMQVQHSIPRVIKVQYVRHHQDYDTNTLETLSLLARLNILVDAGTHQA